MRISAAKRRAAKGVATIEVLVAVAVVVMVGTLGILTFGGTDKATLRKSAAETALFLEQGRLRALEAGRPIEIAVDGNQLKVGAEEFAIPPNITVTPAQARLLLQPTGASEGLALDLRLADHGAQVTLDWLTGRVTVN